MSAAFGHPHKTELGLDELRRRTRGLSQRHRTMLLLVNGKRTRREVLTLAGQAGVGAEFFEELVAMGMVDPAPPVVAARTGGGPAEAGAEPRSFAAPSEWPVTSPGPDVSMAPQTGPARREPKAPATVSRDAVPASAPARRDPVLPISPAAPVPMERTSPSKPEGDGEPSPEPQRAPQPAVAAHKAAAVVSAAAASGPPRPRRAAPPVLTLDDAVPLAATRASPRKTPTPEPVKPSVPTRPPAAAKVPAPAPATVQATNGRGIPRQDMGEPISARMRFSSAVHKPKAPTRRAPPVELRQEPHLTPVKPPGRPARIKMLAPAGPLDDESEMHLLAEVRSLLIGTLLVDGPLTSSLTALRVRKARNRYDLTALVWEIERTLVRARRPREAQLRLAKARDLLGLGNTVTDEETTPGGTTRT